MRVFVRFRGGASPNFSSVSQARALSFEPERVQACPNYPRACFEPELFTNKNAKIRVQALQKYRLIEPRAWGLLTVSQKLGPGLRARAQDRSTSSPVKLLPPKIMLTSR